MATFLNAFVPLIRFLREGLWALALTLGLTGVAAPTMAEELPLQARISAPPFELALSAASRRWLEQKKVLVVGTSGGGFSPFYQGERGYEGISADVLGIVEEVLGISIRVQRYPDRPGVMAALLAGEVDMVDTSNQWEARLPGVKLTTPYVIDLPVFATRIGANIDADMGERLAVAEDYLPDETIASLLPGAGILHFPTLEQALSAVAFGQAEVALGDAVSVYSLINSLYVNDVEIARVLPRQALGFGFAVRAEDHLLRELLDRVLGAIPEVQRENILKRWSGGGLSFIGKSLDLSAGERQWLAEHPVVRVAVLENFPPFSYYDQEGRYRGINGELLSWVSLMTGLRFEIARMPTIGAVLAAARRHEVEMVADLTPHRQREGLLFTRAYQQSPFVLVTRNAPDAPQSLAALRGKRVAIKEGHILTDLLAADYPDIQLVFTKNTGEALSLARERSVDATVMAYIEAGYYLVRMAGNELRIGAALEGPPGRATFAVRADIPELHGILEKALLSIQPDELSVLGGRWRTTAAFTPSLWENYRRLFFRALPVAVSLLLLALLWNLYMRRQIRQRRRAEEALGDQLHFMEVLLNGIPHPIYVRDLELRLLMCNDSYLQTLHVSREAVIGKDVVKGGTVRDEEAARMQEDYRQALRLGQPLMGDREVHVAGESMTVYHWLLPYYDAQGQAQGIIGGWLDVSERKAMLEALSEAKEAADQANRTKTAFLATMSHEIRTPMNAVIGLLELVLKRAEQGRWDRDSLAVAFDAANGLQALIGDILDIARIESGKLELNPEWSELGTLTASVVRVFDGLARQKGLALRLEPSPGERYCVLVDPLRYKQILSNLISNALKFTERGEVTVTLAGQVQDAQRLRVTLGVRDTGIGIAPDEQARLFEAFAQIGRSDTRTGAGLGLPICRTLCEKMGGSLSLESEAGRGTLVRVELELPLAPIPSPELEYSLAEPTELRMLRVLVVDDHAANRLLLEGQLTHLGHGVVQAENGEQGLLAWREGEFDLVISDCNMPVMSGYALAGHIRREERERGGAPCVILGLTANAQEEVRERCLAAGMDGCLFKPLGMAELEQALRHHAEKVPGPEREEATAGEPAFDMARLERLCHGNDAMVGKMLETLLTSNRDDLAELCRLGGEGGAAGPDGEALAELAHRIRGAARLIDAKGVIMHCEALEGAWQKTDGHGTLQGHAAALERAMAHLLAALEEACKVSPR
ncbi:ATP-binding protein [Zobellella sp. DQSA1]|uniref:ATP-binding protein n=1 Tax=Zobellella sp. DQSA1 TaxID=3342386 RepID=UPI0035BFC316